MLLFSCDISYYQAMKILFYFLFITKVNLHAKHVEKSPKQIEADIKCPKYFSPSEAVEYGIIDKVRSVEGEKH